MDPEQQDLTGQEAPAVPSSPETVNPDAAKTVPYDRFAEVNRKMREAERRAQELEARFAAIEADKRKADEARLAEQQEWQKLAEQRAAELEQMRQAVEVERLNSLRTRIAAELGLPPALAARLQGAAEEDIRADAEALAALMPPAAPAAPTPPAPTRTTVAPSGEPNRETPEQRRARLFGGPGSSPIFRNATFTIPED